MGELTSIGPDVESKEGVPYQFDFRDVYGSILMDWFEVDESDVQSLLYSDFSYMPILNPCTPTSLDILPEAKNALNLNCFPNPTKGPMQISFDSLDEQISTRILDMSGRELRTIFNRRLSKGTHQFNYDMSDLFVGAYLLRLETDKGSQMTVKILKL
jgi:hypothetical protein